MGTTKSPPLLTPPPSRTARTSPSRSAPSLPSALPTLLTLLEPLLELPASLSPLLLLLSVLPVLLVLLEEWRLSATELDLSTTTLASVRLMPKPMLSTELDTVLPLLLPLEDTPLPPTATLSPGGCASPGLLRLPARSPTLSVCLSLSAPACPSAPPSPGPSVTPPPGLSATPSPGR